MTKRLVISILLRQTSINLFWSSWIISIGLNIFSPINIGSCAKLFLRFFLLIFDNVILGVSYFSVARNNNILSKMLWFIKYVSIVTEIFTFKSRCSYIIK